ncbi:MAG: gliding motility-associated C-terminal domain-containing protein [Cytophagales bacterium]|nr:gliding motility-associated C-terminal domain-containing protein [Cytophagales bacterium]
MKIYKHIYIIVSVAIFMAAGLCGFSQDITATGGTLTVHEENGGGSDAAEGSTKVIDNDISTKFLSHFPDLQWIQFQLNTPAVVGIYTLTAGNDAPERDPKDWTLEGSHNGTEWTVLDTRTNMQLGGRFNTTSFEIENSVAYEYYRLYITALNGSGTFQLGEWRLLEAKVPEAPTDLSAVSSAGDEIFLTWEDNSSVEKGFQLERSIDNLTFEKIADFNTNEKSFYDSGLNQGTTYYYRIRSYNSFGTSDFAATVEVTTLDYSGALMDITDDGGTLTVSKENDNENENSPKFIDNDVHTKFLVGNTATLWTQYESRSAFSTHLITKYSITSANDAPGRDPRNWTFEGSNDGSNWVTLDTRTNEDFPSRFQERSFTFVNGDSYRYFRLNMTANHGSDAYQMAEWQIFGIPLNAPAVPANLTVTEVAEYSISIRWDDVANNESGYEISRSTDGYTFAVIDTVEADLFTDNNLKLLTTYYYKVRAINSSGNSIYSSVVNAKTIYDEKLPLPAESLNASPLSETEIALSWADRAHNETGYDIERALDGEEFSVVVSVGENGTSYTDRDVKLATSYYYRVRPFNDYSIGSGLEVPYTPVVQVTTLGTNQAPTMAELMDQNSCNYTDAYTVPVDGLTPGPEPDQELSLSVTTDNGGLFSELSVSGVEKGRGYITYMLNEGIIGEANVTVTVTDDGGTLNGGTDSFSRVFKITAYELDIEITRSYTSEKVPRGDVIELTVTGEGGYSYRWQEGPGILSDLNDETITIKPNQNHVYVVTANTSEGCTKDAESLVQMEGSPYLIESNNILTPNGDTKNDTWVVWNINTYPGNHVKVYDLEGRVVFDQHDYDNSWEGTFQGNTLSSGTYYYIINLGSGIPIVKGTLTILHY